MKKLKVLGICGSLREKSRNMGLLRYIKSIATDYFDFSIADISKLPFYNEDIKEKPEAVLSFFKDLKEADALILACPEYNYSIAPALKNALDWASREKGNYLISGKTATIVGAGGGMGTGRAQYHLRQVCVFLNLHLLNNPEFFSNAFSESFNEKGDLVDENLKEQMQELLKNFADFSLKFKN